MIVPIVVDTNVLAYRRDAWIPKHRATAVEEAVRVRGGN